MIAPDRIPAHASIDWHALFVCPLCNGSNVRVVVPAWIDPNALDSAWSLAGKADPPRERCLDCDADVKLVRTKLSRLPIERRLARAVSALTDRLESRRAMVRQAERSNELIALERAFVRMATNAMTRADDDPHKAASWIRAMRDLDRDHSAITDRVVNMRCRK